MTDQNDPSTPTVSAQHEALISAGLQDQLLLPGHDLYEQRLNSWWSATSRLKPSGIFQPRTADEVSKAVVALKNAGVDQFAVRSGGHSHWAGGSNIDNGVTIDLAHLNTTTYNPDTQIASVGPSPKWSDVFIALEKEGVLVAGGRDGNVGVAGFLTGGGNAFFTGRHGFGCDSIINAEVVLSDGRIVNANANENADLWRSLKGGSGNFGIVTKFDLKAFPCGQIWGGIRASAKTEAEVLADFLVKFTDNYHKHPEAAFLMNFTYQPTMVPDIIIAHVLVDTDGLVDAPVFDEVRKVPELFSDIKTRPVSGMAIDYVLPTGLRNVWHTLTFKNDIRVVRKAGELHEQFVAELTKTIPPKELVTQSMFQPLPKLFAEIGEARGGNVLGLDKVEGNALLWLCAVSVHSVEHEPLVEAKIVAMAAELDAYAESIDASVPWVYLNYADPSQSPIASYGEENVKFLREVSKKYDPEGVFQTHMRSGFKLP